MLIKRVGGKSKLAKWIACHLPSCAIFVDVFGGSGAVLDEVQSKMGKNTRYVFNDFDDRLFLLFKVMQSKPEQFAEIVNLTPYSRHFFNEAYEALKNPEIYDKMDDVGKALCFLIVNRQSFGAKMTDTWSITRDGEVNYETWKKIPDEIISVHKRWKSVYLENLDYRELLNKWDDEKTTLYFDPPYEGVEDLYYEVNKKGSFDHIEMFECLTKIKGSFCVSYYGGSDESSDTDLIKKYIDFGCSVKRQKVAKHLSNREEKSYAVEVLLIKDNGWSSGLIGNKKQMFEIL